MHPIPVALILSLLVGGSSGTSAERQSPFEDLGNRVEPGKLVRVEDSSGQTIRGRLAALTPDALTVQTSEGLRRIPREEVSSVAVERRFGKRGALVGAAIGAVTFIPFTRGEHPDSDAPFLGALLGAAAGSITGALIPGMKTVYRSEAGTKASVTAQLGRGRTGLIIDLRW